VPLLDHADGGTHPPPLRSPPFFSAQEQANGPVQAQWNECAQLLDFGRRAEQNSEVRAPWKLYHQYAVPDLR
jgi:hypothetical protein